MTTPVETAIDYLFCHVIVLGLPTTIDEEKLASSLPEKERIQVIRVMDDPTFIGKSAVIFKFDDCIATNTALVRLSLMLRGSPAVVMNASAYLRSCAEYLELQECVKPQRIIARGLTHLNTQPQYLILFRKFGTIKQHKFMRLGYDDFVLIVEYSCAIECLTAQLCLNGTIMARSIMTIQRVPNCYFPFPQLKNASKLTELNQDLLQSEEEDSSKTELLSPQWLQAESLQASGSLQDLENLPDSESSDSKTQSLSSSDYLPYSKPKQVEMEDLTLEIASLREATDRLVISTYKTFCQEEDEKEQIEIKPIAILEEDEQEQIEIKPVAEQSSSAIEQDVKIEMEKKFGAIPKTKSSKKKKSKKRGPKRDSSSDN